MIVTYGFRSEGILGPMRELGYDEVSVVTGRVNTERKEFLELLDLVPLHDIIVVDVFNFWDSFTAICDYIKDYHRSSYKVKVCASGGTNSLNNAALLASWCSKQLIGEEVRSHIVSFGRTAVLPQFPIAAIEVDFTDDEKEILDALTCLPTHVNALCTSVCMDRGELEDTLFDLEANRYVYIERGIDPEISLTPKGLAMRDFLNMVRKIS